jgi:hypothetical protein
VPLEIPLRWGLDGLDGAYAAQRICNQSAETSAFTPPVTRWEVFLVKRVAP